MNVFKNSDKNSSDIMLSFCKGLLNLKKRKILFFCLMCKGVIGLGNSQTTMWLCIIVHHPLFRLARPETQKTHKNTCFLQKLILYVVIIFTFTPEVF